MSTLQTVGRRKGKAAAEITRFECFVSMAGCGFCVVDSNSDNTGPFQVAIVAQPK